MVGSWVMLQYMALGLAFQRSDCASWVPLLVYVCITSRCTHYHSNQWRYEMKMRLLHRNRYQIWSLRYKIRWLRQGDWILTGCAKDGIWTDSPNLALNIPCLACTAPLVVGGQRDWWSASAHAVLERSTVGDGTLTTWSSLSLFFFTLSLSPSLSLFSWTLS